MDTQDLFDRFEFYYYCVFYEQLDPVTTVQLEAFVTEWQMDLTSEGETHLAQFIANAFLIRRFQQAGT
jgi:hypothetical protein